MNDNREKTRKELIICNGQGGSMECARGADVARRVDEDRSTEDKRTWVVHRGGDRQLRMADGGPTGTMIEH